jgi:hypothetical protein
MEKILTVLGIIYVVIGLVVYFLTMQKSDSLQQSIASHSPLNTYIYTHKWLWLMIVCLWPIWLVMHDKLPDEPKKGPF